MYINKLGGSTKPSRNFRVPSSSFPCLGFTIPLDQTQQNSSRWGNSGSRIRMSINFLFSSCSLALTAEFREEPSPPSTSFRGPTEKDVATAATAIRKCCTLWVVIIYLYIVCVCVCGWECFGEGSTLLCTFVLVPGGNIFAGMIFLALPHFLYVFTSGLWFDDVLWTHSMPVVGGWMARKYSGYLVAGHTGQCSLAVHKVYSPM